MGRIRIHVIRGTQSARRGRPRRKHPAATVFRNRLHLSTLGRHQCVRPTRPEVRAMIQQGQVLELKRRSREGELLWAFRYRIAGRGSRRVQRGGFASEQDASDALDRELERIRRERRTPRSLTLAELVETYLAQHDVQPVTISKLRWLLGKAIAVFGDRRVGELTSQEIAEWRMTLSPGYRFEATQALRQVLQRAVAWGMLDINPAKVGVDNPTPRRKEQR